MSEKLSESQNERPVIVYKNETDVNRLWLVNVLTGSDPQPLTPIDYPIRGAGDWGTTNEEFDWSPDSKNIIFAYTTGSGLDNFYMDSSIARVDLATLEITPWEKEAQHESSPQFSPDGERVAYLSSELKTSYACTRYIMLRKPDGSNKTALAPTLNEGPLLAGPSLLGWSGDGKSLLFFEPCQTKYHIQRVPTDGSPAQTVASKNVFFSKPRLSPDKTLIGFVAENSSTAPEAYLAQLETFEPIQISAFNEFFKNRPLAQTEVISWKSKDGQIIQGLLTYPQNYQKGKQYPLLLNVHGGPMFYFNEIYSAAFSHLYPHAAFAEAGIATLRPNPRGSTGYGREFRHANYGDWGGRDYEDVISGVDYLIDQGLADPERLGMMGWSYGGYMTALAVTKTDRFKAVSIGAAPSNLVSMAGTTDLSRFLPDYLGTIEQNESLYRARSPITYAHKVTTPCLIQHGMEDKRVPVTQAYELYHALNQNKKIALLEIYPGMQHGPSQPKAGLDIMERNLNWFKEHLLTDY